MLSDKKKHKTIDFYFYFFFQWLFPTVSFLTAAELKLVTLSARTEIFCIGHWCTLCLEHIFVRPCHFGQHFKTCLFRNLLFWFSCLLSFTPTVNLLVKTPTIKMCEKPAGWCCDQLWFMLQYLLSFFLDHLMNYPAEGTFGQQSRNVAGANGTKWTNMVKIYARGSSFSSRKCRRKCHVTIFNTCITFAECGRARGQSSE